ncbi:MAG: PD-(D/E)XK nuclease family protein [Lactobacillaceae bacterium]|jgi:ATP-dependent helicase/nuclease subunit B|nr:PD-(D/E)XK nuclease family protein [Lactobacillaceae bacterium]
MSLTILFGDRTKDHELALLKNIQQAMQANPQAQIFYLVPNKIKFQTEINVLDRLAQLDGRIGATVATQNVQVFSLSRLAWFYMNDTKLYKHANVSPEALAMLIQDQLKKHQDELQLYGNLLTKQGFISQFASQILELKQSGLQWADVEQMAEALASEVVLQQKLHDLALIGRALDQELGARDQFLSSDMLGVLKAFLLRGERDLSQQYFYINGYSQMTVQERGVVEALISQSAGVTIALPSEDGAASVTTASIDENDLFYAPKMLAQQLRLYATQNQIAVQASNISDERKLSDTLKNVADFWLVYEEKGIQPYQGEDLQIWEATSRYQEVEQLAQKIRMDVVEGRARYRDYLLMTPDLKQYENILPAVFAKYDLPLFMDVDRLMTNHPLVALLDDLLTVAPHYALLDVMKLLKTELFLPAEVSLAEYREALAITENYALAKNLSGWKWTDATPWQYDYRVDDDSDEALRKRSAVFDAQLALIHQQITEHVAPFLTELQEAKSARSMARMLYQFLTEMGVQQRLLEWRDNAIEQGDLAAAQQSEQVWDKFIGVLDDFVSVFDETQMSTDSLAEIFTAAFSNAKYSGIPAAMDQILVTETGIVQVEGVKNVMIFGATSANLPATVRQRALLQDSDRLKLNQLLPVGAQLRETADATMAQDSLRIYNAMLTGTQTLLWSYPTSDGASKAKPSTYIERLQRSFNTKIQRFEVQPSANDSAELVTEKIGTVASTLSNFILAKREAKRDNRVLSQSWSQVEKTLSEIALQQFQQLMASVEYSNQSEQVTAPLIQSVFSDTLRTSISRLESYARNPYEFFLKYGLRLEVRQELQMTSAEQGTFMHAVLEETFAQLQGQPLGALSDAELRRLEQEAVTKIFATDDPTFDIFQTTKRMDFITQNLEDRVHQALVNMQRGQRTGAGVTTLGTEVSFGRGKFEPLRYQVNGHEVVVRGKIDRYDQVHLSQGDKDYVAIVDYKSSKRTFDYNQAFNGLELQLMTYWQAMEKNLQNVGDHQQMGSASFWTLQTGMTEPQANDGTETFAQQREIGAENANHAGKYRGILVDDGPFIDRLETEAGDAPFAIKKNKNGSFAATADVVDSATIETLKQFNAQKIQLIARDILVGKFPIEPFRDGKKTALTYSDYKDVMRFDAMIDNRYRDLEKAKKADMIEKMAQIVEREGGAENELH